MLNKVSNKENGKKIWRHSSLSLRDAVSNTPLGPKSIFSSMGYPGVGGAGVTDKLNSCVEQIIPPKYAKHRAPKLGGGGE
jgi:hypothetical protein